MLVGTAGEDITELLPWLPWWVGPLVWVPMTLLAIRAVMKLLLPERPRDWLELPQRRGRFKFPTP